VYVGREFRPEWAKALLYWSFCPCRALVIRSNLPQGVALGYVLIAPLGRCRAYADNQNHFFFSPIPPLLCQFRDKSYTSFSLFLILSSFYRRRGETKRFNVFELCKNIYFFCDCNIICEILRFFLVFPNLIVTFAKKIFVSRQL
jgi:hypothetical protein